MLKNKAQMARESIKTTLDLPGPLNEPWIPAESEFGSALVMCLRAHNLLRPSPSEYPGSAPVIVHLCDSIDVSFILFTATYIPPGCHNLHTPVISQFAVYSKSRHPCVIECVPGVFVFDFPDNLYCPLTLNRFVQNLIMYSSVPEHLPLIPDSLKFTHSSYFFILLQLSFTFNC